MANYDEEIFETTSTIDDKCSLIEEGYWYENDLLLAAELGKTLLERNKNLETQLSVQTKNSMTLRMEIDLLKKQLETLRELNRNKMLLYEDVDRNSHELEMTNKNLSNDNKKHQDRVKTLTLKNSYLEQQIDEKSDLIEQLQVQLNIERKNSNDNEYNNMDYTSQIEEEDCDAVTNVIPTITSKRICQQCNELKRSLANCEMELEIKCSELDEIQSNMNDLSKKLHYAEVELEDLKCVSEVESKLMNNRTNGQHQNNSLEEDLYNSLEYDIENVEGKPIGIGQLQSGGQVLSNQQSLDTIGAEVISSDTVPSSLLTELDNKYSSLVNQYESLLSQQQGKSDNKNSLMSTSQFQHKLDNIFSEETRRQRKLLTTQNYQPKYKELFRDAFSLLKDMKQHNSNLSLNL